MADTEMRDADALTIPEEDSVPELESEQETGSKSDDSSSDGEPFLAVSRSRRANAGNRMAKLLQLAEAEDAETVEEYGEIFQEFAGDDEFHGGEDDDDVALSSSDEDEGDEGQDEEQGEKDLRKEEKSAMRKKRKRETLIQQMMKKKVAKIMPSAPAVQSVTEAAPPVKAGPGRPKKKSERVSWLVDEADAGPTRASSRTLAMQSKEAVTQRLKKKEQQRLKTVAVMREAEARKEAKKAKVLTQADRLAEAARIEKKNSKTVSRWEEAERIRAEEQQARLEALKNRRLEGPVITYYSGPGLFLGDKMKTAGRTLVEEQMLLLEKEQEDNQNNGAEKVDAIMTGAELLVGEASSGADNMILDAPTPSQADIEANDTDPRTPTADPLQTAVVDAMKIEPTSPQATHSNMSESVSNPTSSTPTAGNQTLQIVIPSAPATTASESVAAKSATTIASSTPVSTNQSASNTPITETPAPAPARWTPASILSGTNPFVPKHLAPKASPISSVTNSPSPSDQLMPSLQSAPISQSQTPTSMEKTAVLPNPGPQSRQAIVSETTPQRQTVAQDASSVPSTNPQIPRPMTIPPEDPIAHTATTSIQAAIMDTTLPDTVEDTAPPAPPPLPTIAAVTLLTLRDFDIPEQTSRKATEKEPHLIRALLEAPDFSNTKLRPIAKTPCSITGVPARYRDPTTGLPYADVAALKVIKSLAGDFDDLDSTAEVGFIWSSLLGCYVGKRNGAVADGVPKGFATPLTEEELEELIVEEEKRVADEEKAKAEEEAKKEADADKKKAEEVQKPLKPDVANVTEIDGAATIDSPSEVAATPVAKIS